MADAKGLSDAAHRPLKEGERYEPYVSASESPPEFTIKAIGLGILFGILFGAANAYLGLVAGLTISTSIPVAVMTVAAFRLMRGKVSTSILEANTAQTVGSASSSVASGVIFTLPALFLWEMPPTFLQMTLLAMCGGLIGVLFMVPLRRYLIEREHGKLPYPEGTACGEVLVASEVGGGQAKNVFYGLGAGALFKLIVSWAKLVPGKVEVAIPFLKKGAIGCKMSAALFGVGYILGPRIGLIMVGGGLLSSLIIIPVIAYWGEGMTMPFYPETTLTISQMTASQLWNRYVRYIGAGAVATGGLITLIRSIPTMIESFRVGTKQLRERMARDGAGRDDEEPRTSRELSLKTVGMGLLVVGLVMALVPQVFGALPSPATRPVAAILVVICAFFFVTVSSRIVGLVGVTSNPTSGMTIATLLLTSSVFLLLGWTDDLGKAAALTVGCVVALSASIAGDTSQDLKTGFLLGATPRHQQIGELVGVLTSAAFVCLTVLFLAKSTGFGTEELPAPQATLMKLVIGGVLDQNLPWSLVGIGAVIAVACELVKIPSLPFAVGVYLPVSTMVPVLLGGALRHFAMKRAANKASANKRRDRGILFGSGLVGGEGLLGVAIAGAAGYAKWSGRDLWKVGYTWAGSLAPWLALAALCILALTLYRLAIRED